MTWCEGPTLPKAVTEKNVGTEILKDLYALSTPEWEQMIFGMMYVCRDLCLASASEVG